MFKLGKKQIIIVISIVIILVLLGLVFIAIIVWGLSKEESEFQDMLDLANSKL